MLGGKEVKGSLMWKICEVEWWVKEINGSFVIRALNYFGESQINIKGSLTEKELTEKKQCCFQIINRAALWDE